MAPFALLAFSVTAVAITLQPPLGQYGVAHSTQELVDTERGNPFGDDESQRRLMLSIFEPTTPWKYCSKHTEPYMPTLTATISDQMGAEYGFPNGTFASIENLFCDAEGRVKDSNAQIIIFSHGRGTSRLIHSFQATALASQGFVVVTVDHPQDAAFVEYPDGSVVRGVNMTTPRQIATAVTVRQQDISFVIDEIRRRKALKIGGDHHKRVLVVGHSLGGATAAAAMMTDKRIQGGIDLDGAFQPPFADEDIGCPFMLIGSENTTLVAEASWNRIWPRLKRSRVAVGLDGAGHNTFTDLSFLATELGLASEGSPPSDLQASLGDIAGERALEVVTAYIAAFARFVTRSEAALLPKKA